MKDAYLRRLALYACKSIFVNIFDFFSFLINVRFPIWPYAKLILMCWLVLPQFNGAAHVYKNYIRPYYMNPQAAQMWYMPRKRNIFRKQDDILTAAEKYIEQHGTEEFERLITKVDINIQYTFILF